MAQVVPDLAQTVPEMAEVVPEMKQVDPETTLPEGREGFLICLLSAHVNVYLPLVRVQLVPINPVGSITAEFVPNTLSHSNKHAVSPLLPNLLISGQL